MAIARGILFGLFLCFVAFVLFILVLGGGSMFAARQVQSEIEERIVAGVPDDKRAAREMVRQNTRAMGDALLRGERPSAAEIAAANARSQARQDRVSAYARERQYRQSAQGGAATARARSGSTAPMQSARPMVDVSR